MRNDIIQHKQRCHAQSPAKIQIAPCRTTAPTGGRVLERYPMNGLANLTRQNRRFLLNIRLGLTLDKVRDPPIQKIKFPADQ